ncbi:uncharacterized protein LOC135812918 [Sycon ciliatum]|uniref:uncharacterized protein LOC135812918 n=1 Tax=Sycon ciliatum TaxID=27933 RepID=UPI0031F6B6DB
MIFAARQVLEKAIEHQSDLYVLFVDLRKAYDSVPRTALWLVLQKLGVPPSMLQVIRSLHEGMMASVRVGSGQSDSSGVENGLHQGCTLAPMLFNLYFSAVLAHWRSTSTVPSFPMKHRIGRKLVGDRTAKHRLTDLSVLESLFADDAALYTTSYEHMETMVKEFTQYASGWGLTVSVQKTKFLAVDPSVIRADIVMPGSAGDVIGVVSDFTYLGSTISDDGELVAEVTTCLAKASRAFGPATEGDPGRAALSGLSLGIRRQVYQALVLIVLLYGSETWTLKAPLLRRLDTSHRQCVRTILSVTRDQQWQEHLSSEDLAKPGGMPASLEEAIRANHLRWLGHLARMDDTRLPKQILFAEGTNKRPRHGPKRRWRDVAASDLRATGIPEAQWYHLAQNRRDWGERSRRKPLSQPQPRVFVCFCGRDFRGPNDLSRNKNYYLA